MDNNPILSKMDNNPILCKKVPKKRKELED